MKHTGENFTGTIDQLLDHCSNLDLKSVQEQINKQNRNDCIEYIKKESGCSEEEANTIYDEIRMEEVDETVHQLVMDGILQIRDYNADGDPEFILTELGKQLHQLIDVNPEDKPTVKKKKK